eukprot:TRINITY_DN38288_c0_g1_i1.p1 TRINITY_DN38288_c0_g1~~TRINITY_DN38288_c0_g1_i1.p1  ORF type:complete len:665 (-),score=67.17 TRINITY_DN38288_c0_g1_i1:204-2198(-)
MVWLSRFFTLGLAFIAAPSMSIRVDVETVGDEPAFCSGVDCTAVAFQKKCPQTCSASVLSGPTVKSLQLKGVEYNRDRADADLNGRYLHDKNLHAFGHEVYRKADNKSLIFWCGNTKSYQVAVDSMWDQVQQGNCMGYKTNRGTLEFGAHFQPKCDNCSETLAASCNTWADEASCQLHECIWQGGSLPCRTSWSIWGPNGPTLQDVGQGQLGASYFLASIGAVAQTHPKIIMSMFVNHDKANPMVEGHELNAQKAFTTEWLVDGRKIMVAVDDRIPVNLDTMLPLFENFREGPNMWPIILEKSWAKIMGGYKAILHGFGVDALKAITKAPASIYWHNQITPSQLWQGLLQSVQRKCPMTCLAIAGQNGIAQDNAYVVLDAKTSMLNGQNVSVVQLYNPWGFNRYSGAIPNLLSADGKFWMLFSEWKTNFLATLVARVRPNHVTSSVEIPVLQRMTASYMFDLDSNVEFSVSVDWPNARTFARAQCAALKPELAITVSTSNASVTRKYDQANVGEQYAESFMEVPVQPAAFAMSSRYLIEIDWHIGSENIGVADWMENMVLSVYAQKPVVLKSVMVNGTSPQNIEADSHQCRFLTDRLKSLNNGLHIQFNGEDKIFPAELQSIADPGETCGDDDQGLSAPCGKYDTWATFDSLMASQAPWKPPRV